MIEVGRMMRSLRHSFTDSQVMMHTCIQLRPQSLCSFYFEVAVALKGNPLLTVSKFLKVSVGHILWLQDISPFEKSPPIRNNFLSSISGHFCFVILNLIHSSISKQPGMTPKYVVVNHYHVSIEDG